ncbi:hypothetical protein SAMD00023353_2701380 [Rosellinia necatrix]|uniref:Uncharacterized protein n=1 Tax=Rosellinia necatrix TaxID=77044 RepID=A0A1S8A8C2_ROSNE|nr:hypothetical protein SAMD00023353_2701380 [Rosellinia necatrix]
MGGVLAKTDEFAESMTFDISFSSPFYFGQEVMANDLLVSRTAPSENNSLQVVAFVFTLARGRLGGTVVCGLPAR